MNAIVRYLFTLRETKDVPLLVVYSDVDGAQTCMHYDLKRYPKTLDGVHAHLRDHGLRFGMPPVCNSVLHKYSPERALEYVQCYLLNAPLAKVSRQSFAALVENNVPICQTPVVTTSESPRRLKLSLNTVPGYFRDVCILDYDSLYPNILLRAGFGEKMSLGYRNTLESILATKQQSRAKNYTMYAKHCKQLANVMYGLFGCPGFKGYNPELCFAVRELGQTLLHKAKDILEQHPRVSVIGGKTDSIMFTHDGPETCETLKAEIERVAGVNMKYEAMFTGCCMFKSWYVGKTNTGQCVHKGGPCNMKSFNVSEKRFFDQVASALLDAVVNVEAVCDLALDFHDLQSPRAAELKAYVTELLRARQQASLSTMFLVVSTE